MRYKIRKKQIVCGVIAIVIAWCITSIMMQTKETRLQENLAKEVFRFHVLANSDSKEDQELKLKVKEEIISYMKEQLPESESVGMTKEWTKNHLKEIKKWLRRHLLKKGLRIRSKLGLPTVIFQIKHMEILHFREEITMRFE